MTNDREYLRALEAAEGKVHVQIFEDSDGFPMANVVWGLWISDGVPRPGSSEGPMSVPNALRRADEVAALYEIDGVVVSVTDDRLWDEAWGFLQPRPGSTEDADESADDLAGNDVPTRQWI
ncbi:MAG TPA: hypothetical protein VL418_15695 [Devosiaceae bacterium]|nr:hypothetical protein [Devosiaceae bacterium]